MNGIFIVRCFRLCLFKRGQDVGSVSDTPWGVTTRGMSKEHFTHSCPHPSQNLSVDIITSLLLPWPRIIAPSQNRNMSNLQLGAMQRLRTMKKNNAEKVPLTMKSNQDGFITGACYNPLTCFHPLIDLNRDYIFFSACVSTILPGNICAD